MKLFRPAAVPTPTEIDQLLACAQGNARDTLVLRLFYASGLRLTELLNLHYADVLWDESRVFVRDGKDHQDRYAPVDHVTLELLRTRQATEGGSRIFPLSPMSLKRLVNRYARKSGLYDKYLSQGLGLSAHSLRHAFATHQYENGMALRDVKFLLGHTGYANTELYLKTADKQLGKAYRECHPWARP